MKYSVHTEAAVAGMIEAMRNPTLIKPKASETYGDAAQRIRTWCRQVLKRKERERLQNTALVRDRVSDGHGIIQHLCEQRPDLAAKWIVELVLVGRDIRYEAGIHHPEEDHAVYAAWQALDASLERWAGLIGWDDEPSGAHRYRRNELERILKMGQEQ